MCVVFAEDMEATFTLYTMRQQLAFRGKIIDKRLKAVFKFGDEKFLRYLKLFLGDCFMNTYHQ